MNKKPIYRKDYKVSNFLIKTTHLTFEIVEDMTVVTAEVCFYKNVESDDNNDLFLDGKNLELLSMTIDTLEVEREVSDIGVMIKNVPNEFTLITKTMIHPETNTSLNGLYKSSGNFCTQCEAHGFREITYYLDRPDVLSVWTTTIIADKQKYPVLLSNGNLTSEDAFGVTWSDPHPKPCYLFALVAGDLALLEDTWITKSKRKIALKIFVEKHNLDKTQFAMESLKHAFKWDEERFNLEYDLDTFMIVAVDDFNMGAMENKGLNIFNSHYVLANPNTATDDDFMGVEAVIGHEYFHNWTGNRITCRDWFQLSLKEGLTVFRDQEFSADLHDRNLKRIEDVSILRASQFYEDAGPMAHPVRPESYIEMNNFYTVTVYEKGAELVRMIWTILGEENFQKGMALYVERFDGKAVTIDDFIQAMSDSNNYDFEQFKQWYSQAGTPKLNVTQKFENNTYSLTFTQENAPFVLPIKYALFDKQGQKIQSDLAIIDKNKQVLSFDNLDEKPVVSLLRDFSAPIKLSTDLTLEDKLFLLANEDNAFTCWDIAQNLWFEILTKDLSEKQTFKALETFLDKNLSPAITAEIFTLPSEKELQQYFEQIDIIDIHNRRKTLIKKIANAFDWAKIYTKFKTNEAYEFSQEAIANRSLKNIALSYISRLGDYKPAFEQFQNSANMTDKLSALRCLMIDDNEYQAIALDNFYQTYQDDVQVLDKWFATQAIAQNASTVEIEKLMTHPKFIFDNPNRLRSVISTFTYNHKNFHTTQGYELVTKNILILNKSNPQIGARLVGVFNHWKKFIPELSAMQKQQLEIIANSPDLSNDIFEIVQNALK
jgi:aminopeptidase N